MRIAFENNEEKDLKFMRKTTKKKRCKEALHCQERSKKERKIKNLKPIHSTKATKTIQKKEEKSRDTRQIE
jgi:hypothetical protein